MIINALRETHELSGTLAVDCLFLGEVSDVGDVVFGPYFGQHFVGLGLGGGAQGAVTPLSKCHFSIPIGVGGSEEST
jgi:hypothetical protein